MPNMWLLVSLPQLKETTLVHVPLKAMVLVMLFWPSAFLAFSRIQHAQIEA